MSVGENVFGGCSKLTAININEENGYYISKDGVLFDKEMNTLISYPIGNTDGMYVIPDGVTSIGDSAFAYCKTIAEVTIPDSVTNICSDAFYYCQNLSTVSVGKGVTTIGYSAFYGCSFTTFSIPNGVTSIEYSAFAYCGKLTAITIPDSVTSIAKDAFTYCSSLADATIGSGVTNIPEQMFYSCGSLKTVTFSKSVTGINNYAFRGCNALENVNYVGTETDWNKMYIGYGNEPLINATRNHLDSLGASAKVTQTTDGKAFDVTLANVPHGAVVILALYKGSAMAETQIAIYSGEGVPFATEAEYTSGKVMIWESFSSLKPICGAEISS